MFLECWAFTEQGQAEPMSSPGVTPVDQMLLVSKALILVFRLRPGRWGLGTAQLVPEPTVKNAFSVAALSSCHIPHLSPRKADLSSGGKGVGSHGCSRVPRGPESQHVFQKRGLLAQLRINSSSKWKCQSLANSRPRKNRFCQ